MPSESSPSRRYRVPESVVSRRVRDEAVLLDLESGEYFGLDPVGTRIWETLEETGDPALVVERLLAEFDVDRRTLGGDVDRLLGELATSGLLEPAPG